MHMRRALLCLLSLLLIIRAGCQEPGSEGPEDLDKSKQATAGTGADTSQGNTLGQGAAEAGAATPAAAPAVEQQAAAPLASEQPAADGSKGTHNSQETPSNGTSPAAAGGSEAAPGPEVAPAPPANETASPANETSSAINETAVAAGPALPPAANETAAGLQASPAANSTAPVSPLPAEAPAAAQPADQAAEKGTAEGQTVPGSDSKQGSEDGDEGEGDGDEFGDAGSRDEQPQERGDESGDDYDEEAEEIEEERDAEAEVAGSDDERRPATEGSVEEESGEEVVEVQTKAEGSSKEGLGVGAGSLEGPRAIDSGSGGWAAFGFSFTTLVAMACVAALVGGAAAYYYRRGGAAPAGPRIVQLGSLPGGAAATTKYVPLVQEQGAGSGGFGSSGSTPGGALRSPERTSSGGGMKLGAQRLGSPRPPRANQGSGPAAKRSDSWSSNW